MRVFVGCEYSATVGLAFVKRGHEVLTCDLLPTEKPYVPHFQGDVFEGMAQRGEWDLIVLHPPCTHLAVSGNRWYAGTKEREEAIEWTGAVWRAAIEASPRVALENPVGALSTAWRPPDQYIQPWQFGHPESKKTGLWLHGLSKLEPTHEKPEKIEERVWRMGPSPDRAKERSRFFSGIAKAMAEQWGTVQTDQGTERQ